MYPAPAHGVRARSCVQECVRESRGMQGSPNVAEDVSGGSVKLGCPVCVGVPARVHSPPPRRPRLPERVSNLTFSSALSQPDASFLVLLGVYSKFRD